ncbi:MAG: carboxypeptidase regulatory-like domain-containing protein [Acidobacteria bacterium]|nr:carboxypeptidase regulatory-like domain-containing protein [Acidobacteriota bacterium]
MSNARYDTAYRLIVEARGYPSTVRDLPPLSLETRPESVRIVLAKGQRPWGLVVDQVGVPVAGAHAWLIWGPSGGQDSEHPLRQGAARGVVSNGRGEFEFPNVSPGQYRLRISHPEYAGLKEELVNVPHGEGYVDIGVFALTAGKEIHGVVMDDSRRPVAGAAVTARQWNQAGPGATRAVATDADGRFRLAGLLPVLTVLNATAPGFAPSAVESVRPGTGGSILIELAEGASLAGRVLGPSGRVVAGVEINLRAQVAESNRVVSGLAGEHLFHRVHTGSEGRFRLDNLAPATWSVEASDQSSRAATEGIELKTNEHREIELRLEATSHLTVLVVTQLGEPVPGADVRVSFESETRMYAFGRTDAGGRAELATGTGAATVEVNHPELLARTREIELKPGVSEVHVRLSPGWEISGFVRSVDGTPIPGAAVEAVQVLGIDDVGEMEADVRRLLRWSRPAVLAMSDSRGGFRLTGLHRGRYRLLGRLSGYTEGESSETIVIDGQSVTGIDVVLGPGTSIRGRVVGMDASDMAAVEIQAWQEVLFRRTVPDIEGNFELEALAPGSWRIVAERGEWRSAEYGVTLEPGSAYGPVELVFEAGFRLTGWVLVAGRPASGGFVSAVPHGQGKERRTRTDHQGRFEFEGLRADSYNVKFRHDLGFTTEQSLDLKSDHYNLLVDLQPRSTRDE